MGTGDSISVTAGLPTGHRDASGARAQALLGSSAEARVSAPLPLAHLSALTSAHRRPDPEWRGGREGPEYVQLTRSHVCSARSHYVCLFITCDYCYVFITHVFITCTSLLSRFIVCSLHVPSHCAMCSCHTHSLHVHLHCVFTTCLFIVCVFIMCVLFVCMPTVCMSLVCACLSHVHATEDTRCDRALRESCQPLRPWVCEDGEEGNA